MLRTSAPLIGALGGIGKTETVVMEAMLETDPNSLSLARATIIELWVRPEYEAGLKLVVPGNSKHYIPVGVWLNVRFTPLVGWKIGVRPNVWPELTREIQLRPLPDRDWNDIVQNWSLRNPKLDGDLKIFTIETDEGNIEFLAKEASREVVDVIQRVIPDE